MLAATLTAVILLGYAGSLWRLLRRESPLVIVGLLALCGVSLSLRLVYTTEVPPGLDDDEPKVLHCAGQALAGGQLFSHCIGIPVLLNALFGAQLIPLVGPTRWAMRSYALVTSVLATPVAFAVARGLGWRLVASFASGALVAVLPWALFFARVYDGGELVFHQLLLLAALARLVFGRGGWPEVGIGTLAQCLLLYDYFCGRAMLPMPLAAAVLATGTKNRLQCVLIPVLALALFWPQFGSGASWGLSTEGLHEGFKVDPIATLRENTSAAFAALVYPVARDGWRTVRSAGMHPPLVLVLAVLGSVVAGPRRGLFLWIGFLGGMAPAIVSWGDLPSMHRMLMAFPFVSLAAAAALDRIPWPRWRCGVGVLVVAVAAFQSVRLFFSPQFWPFESRKLFDTERTALVEALPPPPHPRFILMHQIGYFWGPRALVDDNWELLNPENWFPRDGAWTIYAFTAQAARLRAFYESLFGYERVEPFGRAFLVRIEQGNWAWLRQHGWTYEMECGGAVRRALIPALFHAGMTFAEVHCKPPAVHRWKARWNGPPRSLRLRFSGQAVVEVGKGRRVVDKQGWETWSDFEVEPGDEVHVQVTTTSIAVDAQLLEPTLASERVPSWERWTPLPPPPEG